MGSSWFIHPTMGIHPDNGYGVMAIPPWQPLFFMLRIMFPLTIWDGKKKGPTFGTTGGILHGM